jgi:SAM-dependent methyltransferase
VSAPAASADRLRREIEFHRRISSRAEEIWDWDTPAGRVRAARRAGLFVEHGRLGPGRLALELGCGTGLFLEQVARSGAAVTGLDLSAELLAQARARCAGLPHARLVRGNAEQTAFPAASFDVVYGSSVLHHLDTAAAAREVARLLRPGGRLVFTEPNLLNPQIAVTFLVWPLRPLFGLSPDEMAFTRGFIRRRLASAGLVDAAAEPFDFLHPRTPPVLIEHVRRLGAALERLPGLRSIAGSLLVTARKPA